jgi:hypothetical protein
MLKKWLLPGLAILVLASLALLAPWWWPGLLRLAGSRSAEIQGLTGLVQMILWIGTVAVLLVKLWRPPDTPRESGNGTSVQPLEKGPDRKLPDPQEATRVYLGYLVNAYQYLDLRGMGISDRMALKVPLLETYVPLHARLHTPEGET